MSHHVVQQPLVRPEKKAEQAAAQSQISVSVRGLTKRFGETLALKAVDLDVIRGEFFSLLGPSGCGKTTLLRIVGGFEQPTEGNVLIAGRDAADDPPYRRRTNMIFQHLALFPHMTVAENVGFGLQMKKIDAGSIAAKVGAMLALVRLQGFEQRRIDELSGGQKQRVAIARALVNDPEVLLLDEPLGALDLQLRLQMHDELKRIHREIGSTFILVTHDQSEAIALSDRIGVMENGRIVQLGTPREIYDRPQSRFVAQFVGQANILNGQLESSDEHNQCVLTIDGLGLSGCLSGTVSAGSPISAVLRYEKIILLPEVSGQGFPGTVVKTGYFGSTSRITVRLDNGPQVISEIISNQANTAIVEGARVRAHWSPHDLIIFGNENAA
ncbi:MAG TPA: ABC transporter ATP-binding protein [Terriglobales bacterium]|nr:ABC transporter ATP-binding protein [Terriglobales bacterium]